MFLVGFLSISYNPLTINKQFSSFSLEDAFLNDTEEIFMDGFAFSLLIHISTFAYQLSEALSKHAGDFISGDREWMCCVSVLCI